jgi:hypothetical protein
VAAEIGEQQRTVEAMSSKSMENPAGDWEFKMLRSATAKFRDPVWLRTILEEEARAGWTLVEKFDDARLRLKRPASARAGDAALPFDARRTSVGPGQAYVIVPLLLGSLALIGAVISLAAFFHIGGAR